MPIFACPKCGTHLNVPDTASGQTVGCPRCGQALIIPAAAPSAVAAGAPPQPPVPPPLPSQAPSLPDDRIRSGTAPPPLVQRPESARVSRARPPSRLFTSLPKPILFALFGAVGALIGAILVEVPFTLASPPTAPPPPGRPQLDIMFVLDVTGSMQPQIDGVRDGVKRFVRELQQRNLDVRVGLTFFRDRFKQPGNDGEDPQALRFGRDVFTSDPQHFSEEVGKLVARFGGDEPESALDALAHASRQRFRPGAVRALLLITDAGPKLPDKEMRSIPQTIQQLSYNRIDQLHLIIKKGHEQFEQIQRALPARGRTFQLEDVARGQRFDEVLPDLTQGIAEATIGGVQSRAVYAESAGGRLVLAIGLWTAIIALGVSLALIIGQTLYMGKGWFDGLALLKGSAGIIAGLLGGVIAQGLFLVGQGVAWDILGRLLGWSLLGGLIGIGMALVVPNLVWWRGLVGGVMGGIAGAFCFLLLSLIMPDLLGRWFGALVLGFCIGLMVALAEMAFRRWWLEVRYGPREIRTVTLGAVPVTVGGDDRAATVVVGNAPPLLMRYGLDDDRVWCEEVATGRRTPLEPGDSRAIGNVAITVCNAATRRSAGFVLKLSNGRDVLLSDGLPLTRDELPGLQAQGADGTVAIIQRRPSDPRTLLLLNRSRQPWTATERDGRHRTVTPGMGIAVEPDVRINFGEIHGRLVHE